MENELGRQTSLRSAGKVSLATLISRILGLVREQVFAYLFGAGMAADAFVAAFRIPNLLRDMFAEGALSAAFIPTFTEKLTTSGQPEAFRIARILFTFLLLAVSALVTAGIIFAPAVVNEIAGGFEDAPGKISLTIELARIMMAFLLLVSLAALVMGILNSLGVFGVPAFAPTLLNVGMIVAGFLICPFFDPPIIGMALGVLLGGLGQLLFQVPSAYKRGFRFGLNFNFSDPAFIRIIKLMIPMAVGFSATQINVFIVTRIAASLGEGSVAYLNYAFRLMHLPLGIFALAIATVSLPEISRYAALGDRTQMAAAYLRSLRLGLFLVIPAEVVMVFGGETIIAALFQHGRFTAADTAAAAQALAFYSIGLLTYAAVRITVPVFYAFKETAKPIIASVISVAVNISLCYVLKDQLGFRGLALAASLAGFANVGLLLLLLRRRLPELSYKRELGPLGRVILANLILAAAIFLWERLKLIDPATAGLLPRLAGLTLMLAGGILLYLGAAKALGVTDLQGLMRIFTRLRR